MPRTPDQQLQERILAAAQRLFERQGYAATTMAAIAAEAGVALKTVYLAFETKGGVLRAVWNGLLRGEDDRPVEQHAWYREVLDEPDPDRRLQLNARNSADGKRRVSAIAEVIREAAPSDEEIGALWGRISWGTYWDWDPRITSTLVGVSSLEQLDDNLAALDRLDLSDDELAEIDRYATESGINLWA